MSVVDEAIEDGIRNGRIADQFVPVIDGELACHDGRGASVPVVENFRKIAPCSGVSGAKPQSSKINSSTRARVLRRRP